MNNFELKFAVVDKYLNREQNQFLTRVPGLHNTETYGKLFSSKLICK